MPTKSTTAHEVDLRALTDAGFVAVENRHERWQIGGDEQSIIVSRRADYLVADGAPRWNALVFRGATCVAEFPARSLPSLLEQIAPLMPKPTT